jgi:hypothetical protein
MQDKESELFGLVEAWSQKLNLPVHELSERLKDVTPIMVRLDEHSNLRKAYMETDVRRVCADTESNASDYAPA